MFKHKTLINERLVLGCCILYFGWCKYLIVAVKSSNLICVHLRVVLSVRQVIETTTHNYAKHKYTQKYKHKYKHKYTQKYRQIQAQIQVVLSVRDG